MDNQKAASHDHGTHGVFSDYGIVIILCSLFVLLFIGKVIYDNRQRIIQYFKGPKELLVLPTVTFNNSGDLEFNNGCVICLGDYGIVIILCSLFVLLFIGKVIYDNRQRIIQYFKGPKELLVLPTVTFNNSGDLEFNNGCAICLGDYGIVIILCSLFVLLFIGKVIYDNRQRIIQYFKGPKELLVLPTVTFNNSGDLEFNNGCVICLGDYGIVIILCSLFVLLFIGKVIYDNRQRIIQYFKGPKELLVLPTVTFNNSGDLEFNNGCAICLGDYGIVIILCSLFVLLFIGKVIYDNRQRIIQYFKGPKELLVLPTVTFNNSGDLEFNNGCAICLGDYGIVIILCSLFVLLFIGKVIYDNRQRIIQYFKGPKELLVLPTVTFNNSGDLEFNDGCAICLVDYETGDVVSYVPSCRHGFHHHCIQVSYIDKGLNKDDKCPICRATMTV